MRMRRPIGSSVPSSASCRRETVRTPDLGGTATTTEFADAIVSHLDS